MSKQKTKLLSVESLLSTIAQLQVIPRREAIKTIQWLITNIRKFDPKALARHYGLLLHLLRNVNIPAQPLCKLLILLTSKETVTESRVNILCKIYIQRNNSACIGNLLQEMRKVSDPEVYFPPLGQGDTRNAQIPLSVIFGLQRQVDPDSNSSALVAPEALYLKYTEMCTSLYKTLTAARKASDTEFATLLAQLAPLVQQSGRVILAIEKSIYEYLENEWATELNATSTLALKVLVTFFQYWPIHNMPAVRQRLLDPLLQADVAASKTIIPYLWFFGDYAATLMASCVSLSEPRTYMEWHKESTIERYIHIYQYYSLMSEFINPPSEVLTSLIVKQLGYLPLCTKWASLVPAVKNTLQGDFSLLKRSNNNEKILKCFFPETSDDNVDVRFDVVNTPWLGGYPQRTYSRLKVQGKVKNLAFLSAQKPNFTVTEINSTVLSQINLSNEDFCLQLIEDLREFNIDVFPYLRTTPENSTEDAGDAGDNERSHNQKPSFENYSRSSQEPQINELHKSGPPGSTPTPSTPTTTVVGTPTPTTASTETAAEPEPKRRALDI